MSETRINAVPCTEDRFMNLTDQVKFLGLADPANPAYCPEVVNMILFGSPISKTNSLISLNYDYCN